MCESIVIIVSVKKSVHENVYGLRQCSVWSLLIQRSAPWTIRTKSRPDNKRRAGGPDGRRAGKRVGEGSAWFF